MNKILVLLFAAASVSFSQTPFIRDWLILGTYPNSETSSRLARHYFDADTAAVPRGGDSAGGRRWFLYHAPSEGLDFLAAGLPFAARTNCAVYVVSFVESRRDQDVRLLVGSDDGVAIWLDGIPVHFNDASRSWRADADTVRMHLRSGWNTLLFKVTNGDGGYEVSARFADGEALRVAALNPFPSASALTPPAVSFAGARPEMHFAMSESNAPELSFTLGLLNSGNRPASDIEITLESSRVLSSSRVPMLAGGELLTAALGIPLDDALADDSGAAALTLHGRSGGTDISVSVGSGGSVLRRFFEPWELRGWNEQKTSDTHAEISRDLVVPKELSGLGLEFMVDIGERWGSVTVNGERTLERFSGDSGDLLLTEKAKPGETYRIRIDATSSTPISGRALAASSLRVRSRTIERWLYDTRFAREIYHTDLGDQTALSGRVLSLLRAHDAASADGALFSANEKITALSAHAKDLSLHLIGNAHIDMAWLWRYTETIDVTKATFRSALDNIKRYPDFKFSHGQAQSYYWIEKNDPEMFREIQRYVHEGRWEIVGGTWVEPDDNMPSGEALVRQFFYGKRYFRDKFGVIVRHGWHPDTFGHPATLPEILSGCGIETFSFFRPWEDERMFLWEAPDGSRVIAHRPPEWYNTPPGIDDTLCSVALRTKARFAVSEAVRFFGVGDHGGGPTRREISTIEQLSDLHFYPAITMSRFDGFYSAVRAEKKDLPVIRGEQNSIFEGCYTSQATVKKGNRTAEALLPTSELFSAIASRYGRSYPSEDFRDAWRLVLFNQFHDVLCGSGIHDIYNDVALSYKEAFSKAQSALNGALSRIAATIRTRYRDTQALPLVLFNPLNWSRTEPVEVALQYQGLKSSPLILDERGDTIPCQTVSTWRDSVRFIFVPKDVPSVGYRTYWLGMRKPPKQNPIPDIPNIVLENEFFTVEIDRPSGSISGIHDKTTGRELIRPGALANQFQIQEDDTGMSAWTIGLKGAPKPITRPASITILENGTVRKVIRVEYRYENSAFSQDIILTAGVPRIDFRVSADWHHRRRILKIAFPLALRSAKATFEVPYGSIEREQTGAEYVSQKWADISEEGYGVSLLNDSKYGLDVRDNVIRLTALRSSTDPDPAADEGHHEFAYALYPHQGGWQEAGTARRGFEFNTPMTVILSDQHDGPEAPVRSFIDLDSPNIILTAFKKADDDNSLILRCYEVFGRPAKATLRCWQTIERAATTDLMEWSDQDLSPRARRGRALDFEIKPHEIKTFRLVLGK